MPIANSDFVPDPFPGIALPAGTNAPGSQGSRTPGQKVPLTGWSGIPNVGTAVRLDFLLDDAGAASTEQPGQLDEGISGLGPADTADTGVGRGRAGHWRRFDWQQPDGAQ